MMGTNCDLDSTNQASPFLRAITTPIHFNKHASGRSVNFGVALNINVKDGEAYLQSLPRVNCAVSSEKVLHYSLFSFVLVENVPFFCIVLRFQYTDQPCLSFL